MSIADSAMRAAKNASRNAAKNVSKEAVESNTAKMSASLLNGAKNIEQNILNGVQSNQTGYVEGLVNGFKNMVGDTVASGRETLEKNFGNTKVGGALLNTDGVRSKLGKTETRTISAHGEENVNQLKALMNRMDENQKAIGKVMAEKGKDMDTDTLKRMNAQKSGFLNEMGTINNAIKTGGDYSYEYKNNIIDKGANSLGRIKDYYTTGTNEEKLIKAGVTAGAYVGGAVGLRYLSGGNLTTNADGERDIAGIPLI